jgi:hypothetical protein
MKGYLVGACALLIAGVIVQPVAAGASTGFFPYSQPGTPASPSYTGITCAIDFSSIPDYTELTSVSGCGVTVTFSVPMLKESVPNAWNQWGSPPNTEGNSPAILWTESASSVTLTYRTPGPAGAGRRTVGVEVDEDWYGTEDFTATFTGSSGTDGTISRTVTAPGAPVGNATDGALLFAARTKSPLPKVTSLTITGSNNSSGFGDDFAIAQIRV